MASMKVHEAKTHLSRLLEPVASGEEVVLARVGKPGARLVPCSERPRRRVAGENVGTVVIADDFDAPLPEDLLSTFGS